MADLYTWDYTTLVAATNQPRPCVKKQEYDSYRGVHRLMDSTESDRPKLVGLGLLAPKVEMVPDPDDWQHKKSLSRTSFHITDKGREWIKAVEGRWEEDVQDMRWWRLATTHGAMVLGIPDFLHPEEAKTDLRVLFGSAFGFLPPLHDDQSEGRPHQFGPEWRPWKNPEQAWVDARHESRAQWRGAYMRPYGAPFDPVLSFAEAVGEFAHERLSSFDLNVEDAHKVCFLDSME